MKSLFFLPLLMGSLVWCKLNAQTAGAYPPFRILRAEEDWSVLGEQDTIRKTLWRALKYQPLNKRGTAFFSLGGDVRSELQTWLNEDWSAPNDDEITLFQRLMVHADWRLSPRFRLFTQLKSGFTVDRNGPRLPLNIDWLDIHQLFAEWRFPGLSSRLRVGREELWYGSRRLIDVREGVNVRHSFDGARWIVENQSGRLDLLFYLYNPGRTGVFDNRITDQFALWGAYYVWNIPRSANHHLDLYYLGVRNEITRFDEGNKRELRHSMGLRHWGSLGRLRYNNEAVWQFGTFGDQTIAAWTLSFDLVYNWPKARLQPAVGLRTEIISGDERRGDDRLQTFNPLYPRGGYFGLLALIGPANLMDIHPSFSLNLMSNLQLSLDWDVFWRHALDDGIYLPSGRLNVGSQGSRERFIGHQLGAQLTWTTNRFLEMEFSYFYFITGGFLRELTPGDPLTQIGASFNFKF